MKAKTIPRTARMTNIKSWFTMSPRKSFFTDHTLYKKKRLDVNHYFEKVLPHSVDQDGNHFEVNRTCWAYVNQRPPVIWDYVVPDLSQQSSGNIDHFRLLDIVLDRHADRKCKSFSA